MALTHLDAGLPWMMNSVGLAKCSRLTLTSWLTSARIVLSVLGGLDHLPNTMLPKNYCNRCWSTSRFEVARIGLIWAYVRSLFYSLVVVSISLVEKGAYFTSRENPWWRNYLNDPLTQRSLFSYLFVSILPWHGCLLYLGNGRILIEHLLMERELVKEYHYALHLPPAAYSRCLWL